MPPDQPWRHWSRFQLVPCMRRVCRTWTWGGLLEGGSPHRVRKEETHPRPPLPPWPHPSILLPPQKLPCHWPSRQWLSPGSRWQSDRGEIHSVAAQLLPPSCITASPTNVFLSNSLQWCIHKLIPSLISDYIHHKIYLSYIVDYTNSTLLCDISLYFFGGFPF